MKKQTILPSLALIVLMLFSVNINAQKFPGLDGSPMDVAYFRANRNAPAMIKVFYSRPQLKGRDLSTLAPNGKVWRTGANEATEIHFFQDMNFGGKMIKAGRYSLFTIPGDTEWTVILSKDLDNWGSFSYKEENDALRVTAAASNADESVEAFAITFDDSNMYLGWGTKRVTVPVSK